MIETSSSIFPCTATSVRTTTVTVAEIITRTETVTVKGMATPFPILGAATESSWMAALVTLLVVMTAAVLTLAAVVAAVYLCHRNRSKPGGVAKESQGKEI